MAGRPLRGAGGSYVYEPSVGTGARRARPCRAHACATRKISLEMCLGVGDSPPCALCNTLPLPPRAQVLHHHLLHHGGLVSVGSLELPDARQACTRPAPAHDQARLVQWRVRPQVSVIPTKCSWGHPAGVTCCWLLPVQLASPFPDFHTCHFGVADPHSRIPSCWRLPPTGLASTVVFVV